MKDSIARNVHLCPMQPSSKRVRLENGGETGRRSFPSLCKYCNITPTRCVVNPHLAVRLVAWLRIAVKMKCSVTGASFISCACRIHPKDRRDQQRPRLLPKLELGRVPDRNANSLSHRRRPSIKQLHDLGEISDTSWYGVRAEDKFV